MLGAYRIEGICVVFSTILNYLDLFLSLKFTYKEFKGCIFSQQIGRKNLRIYFFIFQ